MRRFVTIVMAACFALEARPAAAQPVQSPQAAASLSATAWTLDRIDLKSGETRLGIIEAENDREVRFLEIRRPEGRGMYGVHVLLPLAKIAGIDRVPAAERAESRRRFDDFCQRCKIEALKMEDLSLESLRTAGEPRRYVYDGEWFSLESTADEDLTRRAAVRLEQTFEACRLLLSARSLSSRKPQILLFGRTEEHRACLHRLGVAVDHAAVYFADSNTIAVGADLNRLAEQLAVVREQHQVLRAQADKLEREIPDRLRAKREQLEAAGGSEAARRKALLNFKRQAEEELSALQKQLATFNRKNDALFQEQTQHAFALLNHEAFHAYLASFVVPDEARRVPRWLNEGLAQVCESGIWEGETFRIDAPNKPALATLQDDLRSKSPLPLAEVLTADHRSFLVAHGDGAGSSQRHYAYSWGLAYHLSFQKPVLRSESFDLFLRGSEQGLNEQQRFEKLVGAPLVSFERQWRQAMLDLKPAK